MNREIENLQSMIHSLEAQSKQIYDKLTRDFKGDLSYLNDDERAILKSIKQQLHPLRKKLVALNRQLLSRDEKRATRIHLMGLAKKFIDEGDNRLRIKYFELYFNLLEMLEPLKETSIELADIYRYLDEKDFQEQIPDHYLDLMERNLSLKKVARDLREILKVLGANSKL